MPVFGLIAFVALVLTCHVTKGWVPLLDDANLAFHEAGHPLFGFLSETLMVYGGTLMQLLLPAAAGWQMLRDGKLIGFYACIIWIAENLLNIARYMADARAHELPLVGGLDPDDAHDWTEILNRWGVLESDIALANCVRVLAVILMAWAIWRAWRGRSTVPCHDRAIS